MPKNKIIPRVIAHDSDSSSEENEETQTPVQETLTPKTRPEEAESGSNSYEKHHLNSSEGRNGYGITVDTLGYSTVKKPDISFKEINIPERVKPQEEVVNIVSQVSVIPEPIVINPMLEVSNMNSTVVQKEFTLRVFEDEIDMELSDEEVRSVPINSLRKDDTSIKERLIKSGITKESDLSKILENCISKHDRIFCNFNPSSTEKRGCQISFAQEQSLDLVTHLNTFHQANIDVGTEKFPTVFYGDIDETGEDGEDSKSIASSNEASLYNVNSVTVQKSISTNSNENYDPAEEYGTVTVTVQKEKEKKKQVLATKVRKSPIEPVTRPITRNHNIASRVTPKLLRSKTNTTSSQEANPVGRVRTSTNAVFMALDMETGKEIEVDSTEQKRGPKKKSVEAEKGPSSHTSNIQKKTKTPPRAVEKNIPTSRSVRRADRERIRDALFQNIAPLNTEPDEKRVKKSSTSKSCVEKSNNARPSRSGASRNTNDETYLSFIDNMSGSPLSDTHEDTHKPGDLTTIMQRLTSLYSMVDTIMDKINTQAKNKLAAEAHYKDRVISEKVSSSTSQSFFSSPQSANTRQSTISSEGATSMITSSTSRDALSPTISCPGTPFPESLNSNASIVAPMRLNQDQAKTMVIVPPEDIWLFELGFGYFSRNKYHCNVPRSSCKAAFMHKKGLLEHFCSEHRLTQQNAITYRYDEEVHDLENAIAKFIIDGHLPSTIVEEEGFKDLLKSIRNVHDEPIEMPNSERINKLLCDQFIHYQKQVKLFLQTLQSLSLSIHVWSPDSSSDYSFLVTNAHYMDSSWNTKSIVLSFHSVSKKFIESCVREALIEINLVEAIKQFDISDKVHTIINCGFTGPFNEEKWDVDQEQAFIHLNQKKISVVTVCLDQMIEDTERQLLHALETDFSPLQKVNRAYSRSKLEVNKGFPEILALCKVFNMMENSPENLISLIRKYNTVCAEYDALKKYILNEDDQIKYYKMYDLILLFKQSLRWLSWSSSHNYPTSSKLLIICSEISNTLWQLKDLYQTSQTKKCSMGIEDLVMTRSLENIHSIFNKRCENITRNSLDNPYWQALILDTAAFAFYKSFLQSNHSAQEINGTSTISDLTDDQIKAIESILLQRISSSQVSFSTNIAMEYFISINPGQAKRKIGDVVTPEEQREGEARNIKKNCTSQNRTSGFLFPHYFTALKNDQSNLLKGSGINFEEDVDEGICVNEKLLNNQRVNLGQANFWRQTHETYYPEISQITKQSFAIPTTLEECLKASKTARKHYDASSCVYPNFKPEEIQQRTLVHIWKQETFISNAK